MDPLPSALVKAQPPSRLNRRCLYCCVGVLSSLSPASTTLLSFSSFVDWFQTPRSSVSTHYVIQTQNGQIAQCADDTNIAWHAGSWHVNRISLEISISCYHPTPLMRKGGENEQHVTVFAAGRCHV
jgi:N-acetylmuramoyl-L-alanine amidase